MFNGFFGGFAFFKRSRVICCLIEPVEVSFVESIINHRATDLTQRVWDLRSHSIQSRPAFAAAATEDGCSLSLRTCGQVSPPEGGWVGRLASSAVMEEGFLPESCMDLP